MPDRRPAHPALTMPKPTSIEARSTRIIPASPEHKITEVTKQADGSLALQFGDGRRGALAATDTTLQAFAIWTILNPDATQPTP